MVIHVVQAGDTVSSLSREYGVPASQIIIDNGLTSAARLAVGQALVIQFPLQVHTVRPGAVSYTHLDVYKRQAGG